MKKIVLSTLAAVAISATSLSAAQFTLYTDANGQVYTTSGEGRTELVLESKMFTNKVPTKLSVEDKKDIKEELTKEIKSEIKLPFKRITIEDKNSPVFLLGKATHINMKFVADDNPEMWLKAGVRIQGTFENVNTDYNSVTKTDSNKFDAYLRRVRFEVAAGFNKYTSFVMDVRNDKANYQDKNGEAQFNVGDAYVKIKKPFGSSLLNVKLFRAKIDISRTETVKSARVIAYDRPKVADAAAQFITHNRRGTNAQIYGDWKKKIHYQIAMGDATYDGKLADGKGKKTGDITEQSFFYGGKIRLSPFDGWEETKRTESYFGVGKHFSIGASYWSVPSIKATGSNAAKPTVDLNNELVNLEMSAHYKNLFVQAEYFDFKDVVKDWGATSIETGKSTGWYATSEYVMPSLGYIAPFVRYESWDKFKGAGDYDFTSTMAGINWYLKGNSIKAGFVYQKDEYGALTGDKDETKMRITTQFFF